MTSPNPTDPATDDRPPSPHAYFTAAAVILVIAVMLSLAEQYTPVPIARGVFAVLAGLFVVCGVGWLMCSAERRVTTRTERLSEQRYQAGYDDGFVDGAAPGPSVQSINGRRRPVTHG